MTFVYLEKIYKNKPLIQLLNSKAKQLYHDLKSLKVDELPISDYSKGYLKKHIFDLKYLLQMYVHILYNTLENNKKDFSKLCIIDHGGGVGILSLLCSSLKINVIYNDIYDVVLEDFKTLTDKLKKYSVEHFCLGDITEINTYCKTHHLMVDSIISSEVIEHIYDIESFFQKLTEIPSQNLSFVFATSANALNPYRSYKIKKMQKQAEYLGTPDFEGRKQRDSISAFLEIRKNILHENFKQLSEKEINTLSSLTRGKNKSDILLLTELYLKTGTYPDPPIHKTNTCDPLTGNWTEHLMSPFYLKEKLDKIGFQTKIINGYYGLNEQKTKLNFIKKILNLIIFRLKNKALFMSHYWMLKGQMEVKL